MESFCFNCSACGKLLTAGVLEQGRASVCPLCNAKIVIPIWFRCSRAHEITIAASEAGKTCHCPVCGVLCFIPSNMCQSGNTGVPPPPKPSSESKQPPPKADRFTLASEAANQRKDPDAQCRLADMYRTGDGCQQDYGRAAEWYFKAANSGHSLARYKLGNLYRDGKVPHGICQSHIPVGVEEEYWLRHALDPPCDLSEELRLEIYKRIGDYKAAAAMGDHESKVRLMVSNYEEGKSQLREFPIFALENFMRAAKLGHAPSQAAAGHLYLAGRGTKPNFEMAESLFRQACEQEEPDGFFGLGLMHEAGQRLPKLFSEVGRAFSWELFTHLCRWAIEERQDPRAVFLLVACVQLSIIWLLVQNHPKQDF